MSLSVKIEIHVTEFLLPTRNVMEVGSVWANLNRMAFEYTVGVQTEYSVCNQGGRISAGAVWNTFSEASATILFFLKNKTRRQ